MKALLPVSVHGHVKITDNQTGEVLVDKDNAIHVKNMAIAIARGLSNASNYQVFKMKLGNRGTYIDSGTQNIVFNPPNVSNPIVDYATADLYNATYVEIVDDANSSVGVGNSVTFTEVPSTTNTRVIVTCVVSANEGFDNPADTNNSGQINGGDSVSPFFFDELGLFTKETSGLSTDMDPAGELMLSHIIFSPIEHTGNRELAIVYTLTVSVS